MRSETGRSNDSVKSARVESPRATGLSSDAYASGFIETQILVGGRNLSLHLTYKMQGGSIAAALHPGLAPFFSLLRRFPHLVIPALTERTAIAILAPPFFRRRPCRRILAFIPLLGRKTTCRKRSNPKDNRQKLYLFFSLSIGRKSNANRMLALGEEAPRMAHADPARR